VLVPLPSAAADHQRYNARALADAGAAVLLPETDLSGRTLSATVHGLLQHPERRAALTAQARLRGRPNAAAEIMSNILTLADS
jgi:UDP-N-acetylglucosamine--N-acetylmuramyl-(pentapeptide) pyrophosphoryl-undecaprenol N-acetylglucosamine transferase